MGLLRRQSLRAARGLSAPTPKQSKGFPESYKRLRTPIQRMSWLAGEECRAAVKDGRLQQNQVDSEEKRLKSISDKAAPLVPTPSRLSDVWNGEEFPPKPADPANTPRTADLLLNPQGEREVLWPAYWLSERSEGRGKNRRSVGTQTYDYRVYRSEKTRQDVGRGSGRRTESPTTVALEQLEATGGVLVQTKMATEDEEVLRQQIDRYNRTGDMRAFLV